MNIKETLNHIGNQNLYFNDIEVEPEKILAIMINEVVPANPQDDFYGPASAAYLTTTIPLFQSAGIEVTTAKDILKHGIYLTNAVKSPKTTPSIERETIETSLPCLQQELSLFPNVKVIMLMGDVAKKSFNMIAKKATGKNAIPSISTYKIRSSSLYYNNIRLMPSYIMTGPNILIEKSKFQMASEDIKTMHNLITQ